MAKNSAPNTINKTMIECEAMLKYATSHAIKIRPSVLQTLERLRIQRDQIDYQMTKRKATAEKAYQERNSTLLGLENIDANRAADDPYNAITLKAPKGNFDDAESLLILTEGFTGSVREIAIAGRNANYKMNEQQADGHEFAAYGKNGQLLAQLFEADMLQETAYFTGGVRMQIKLKRNEAIE